MSILKNWLAIATFLSFAFAAGGKVPVFLKPDSKAALFKEVAESELLLPKAVENPDLAAEGWHTAKVAVSQVGFTVQSNVMKELSLKPGSKIHVRSSSLSSLIATTTGQETVKVVRPGPWTQVMLTKPVTIYFLLGDEPAVEPIKPIESIVPVEPIKPVVEVPVVEVVIPVVPAKPEPASVVQDVTVPEQLPDSSEPKVIVRDVPEVIVAVSPPIGTSTVKETAAAAVAPPPPPPAIGEFDLLESLNPEVVRESVAPVSSALLEEIQELDPLEVREGGDQPPTSPQLPLEIKPTVTISRNFEGKLIYKKPFFRRPGVRSRKPPKLPYQLVDENGKRIAYVRVDDIKVGNLLNYVNKKVILGGPLEENAKGSEPIIQGRTIRLDLK